MIRWKCAHCETVLRAHDSTAGKKLPCPKCKQIQTVPPLPASGDTPPTPPEVSRPPLPTLPAQETTPKNRRGIKVAAGSILGLSILALAAVVFRSDGGSQEENVFPPADQIASQKNSAQENSIEKHSTPPVDQAALERDGLVDNDAWKRYRSEQRELPSGEANIISIPKDLGSAERGDTTIALQDPSTHPLSNEDYYRLALMASQFYRQGDHLVRLDPEAKEIHSLRSSKSVRVKELFQLLDQSLRQYAIANELQRRASRLEEAAMGNFLGSLFSSDSDTLVATEMSEPGMMRIESLSSYYANEAIGSGMASLGNRANAEQLLNTADATRLAAWSGLKNDAERIASKAKPLEGGIELSVVRSEKRDFEGPFEQVKSSFQGKQLWVYGLRVQNKTGRDLKNVTLAITLDAAPVLGNERDGQADDALHEPNYFFIQHWPAESTLQLLTGNQWEVTACAAVIAERFRFGPSKIVWINKSMTLMTTCNFMQPNCCVVGIGSWMEEILQP